MTGPSSQGVVGSDSQNSSGGLEGLSVSTMVGDQVVAAGTPPPWQGMGPGQSPRSRTSHTAATPGEESPGNGQRDRRVRLNVGGRTYETYASTFAAFPDSLLGAMFSEHNAHLVHPDAAGEFFFDRNGDAFAAVLEWYRSGGRNLHVPPTVTRRMVDAELEFFQVLPHPRDDDGAVDRPLWQQHVPMLRSRSECDDEQVADMHSHGASALRDPKSAYMRRFGSRRVGMVVDRCAGEAGGGATEGEGCYGAALREAATHSAETHLGAPYVALLDEVFAAAEVAAQMGCCACAVDVVANCSYKRMCSSEKDSKRTYSETLTWCKNVVSEEAVRMLQSPHARALISRRLLDAGLGAHDFQRFGRRGWCVRLCLWHAGGGVTGACACTWLRGRGESSSRSVQAPAVVG